MPLSRRTRSLIFGGLGAIAFAGALTLVLRQASWSGDQALGLQFPTGQTGCVDPRLDAGLPITPIDAMSEAGKPLWMATIKGHATVTGMDVAIYGDDVGNLIDSWTISAPGAWERTLRLHHGWNLLIFRVTLAGRTVQTERWLGFDTEVPTWTDPFVPPDGGCGDAHPLNCRVMGMVGRCGMIGGVGGPPDNCRTDPCPDAGCNCPPFSVDAGARSALCAECEHQGCVRGCGGVVLFPDAGCDPVEGCPCRGGGCGPGKWRSSCCTPDFGTPYYCADAGCCKMNSIGRNSAEAHFSLRGLADEGCGPRWWDVWVYRWPPSTVDAGSYDARHAAREVVRKYRCAGWAGTWHAPTVPAFLDAGPLGIPTCEGDRCCVAYYSAPL